MDDKELKLQYRKSMDHNYLVAELPDEVIFTYFFATYPVFPLQVILYQLPEVSLMVTLSPSWTTPTTLLSVDAFARMFRADAVTVPVCASAETRGIRQRIRISIKNAWDFFMQAILLPV